jgi:hypothetical protein
VLAPRQWNSANARSLTIDGRTPSQDRQDHPNDSFIQQQQPGTQISLNHTTEVLHHWPSQSMSVPWITCMLKDVLCRCVGASRSQSQSQKGYCPRQLKVLKKKTRPGRLRLPPQLSNKKKVPSHPARKTPELPPPSLHGGLSVAQVRIGPVTPTCFEWGRARRFFLTQPEIRSHWDSNSGPERCRWSD